MQTINTAADVVAPPPPDQDTANSSPLTVADGMVDLERIIDARDRVGRLNPHKGTPMRKVIALLTHAVGSNDHVAAADCWEYFGSFGDDIFTDDADDPFGTTLDQRRTTARARLVTERRTLNRSQRRLPPRR